MNSRELITQHGRMAAQCLLMAKIVTTPFDQAFLLALAFRWYVLGVENDGNSDHFARAQSLTDSFDSRFP
jgi:hypothetical protein